MRAFIAIELSDSLKDTLSQAQSHLKYSGADVKWIETGKIHLTLKFLGDITEESCEKIKSILDNIEYWRVAPVWTPEKIEAATKDWFKYLSK